MGGGAEINEPTPVTITAVVITANLDKKGLYWLMVAERVPTRDGSQGFRSQYYKVKLVNADPDYFEHGVRYTFNGECVEDDVTGHRTIRATSWSKAKEKKK